MKVLISGSSGLVGSALSTGIAQRGHKIIPLQRKSSSPMPRWSPENGIIELGDNCFDAVIHLAGAPVSRWPWTEKNKARILQSRTDSTNLLIKGLLKQSEFPRVFMCASAVGYYGNRDEQILTEDCGPGQSFLSDVCVNWEKTAASVEITGCRLAIMRFGMIVDLEKGFFPRFLRPFKLKIGGPAGDGNQYISWVGLEDVCRAVCFVLENGNIAGPVNITAPNPLKNSEFSRLTATYAGSASWLRIPAWLIRLGLGRMGEELILSSTRAVPNLLSQHGFIFRHPDFSALLEDPVFADKNQKKC